MLNHHRDRGDMCMGRLPVPLSTHLDPAAIAGYRWSRTNWSRCRKPHLAQQPRLLPPRLQQSMDRPARRRRPPPVPPASRHTRPRRPRPLGPQRLDTRRHRDPGDAAEGSHSRLMNAEHPGIGASRGRMVRAAAAVAPRRDRPTRSPGPCRCRRGQQPVPASKRTSTPGPKRSPSHLGR